MTTGDIAIGEQTNPLVLSMVFTNKAFNRHSVNSRPRGCRAWKLILQKVQENHMRGLLLDPSNVAGKWGPCMMFHVKYGH